MNTVVFGDDTLQRMVDGVKAVAERLRRTAQALDVAGITHAVAGDNATAAWVATVDESAVRFTPSVDFLVRRDDFDRVQETMIAAGFYHVEGTATFVEHRGDRPRNAIRFTFVGEKRRPADLVDAPDVCDSVS